MNHVNLIGNLCSAPRVVELSTGKKLASFSMSTNETFLDENGQTKKRRQWHRVIAWGKWVTIIEELCTTNTELAVEGRLISRFYSENGKQRMVSEVEVNDLIIL